MTNTHIQPQDVCGQGDEPEQTAIPGILPPGIQAPSLPKEDPKTMHAPQDEQNFVDAVEATRDALRQQGMHLGKRVGEGGEHVVFEILDAGVRSVVKIARRALIMTIEEPDAIQEFEHRYRRVLKHFTEKHVPEQSTFSLLVPLPYVHQKYGYVMVTRQRYIEQLQNEHFVLASGYPELKGIVSSSIVYSRPESDPQLQPTAQVGGPLPVRTGPPVNQAEEDRYVQVTKQLLDPSFTPTEHETDAFLDEFARLYNTKTMRKLLTKIKKYRALERKSGKTTPFLDNVRDFVKRAVSFTNEEQRILDIMGGGNVILYAHKDPDTNKRAWNYTFVEPGLPDMPDPINANNKMNMLQKTRELLAPQLLEKLPLFSEMDCYCLLNTLNFVRTINGLAVVLGCQERIHLLETGKHLQLDFVYEEIRNYFAAEEARREQRRSGSK